MIAQPPGDLPCVMRRDLERAWESASAVAASGAPRRFRFETQEGAPLELRVADADAAAWVAAVERGIGLSNLYGVSVCLRLLALVALMAQAAWARDWFSFERGGTAIRPELWRAAALARLNATGGFDETALQALLPGAYPGLLG